MKRFVLAALPAVLILASPKGAWALNKQECIQASERGQQLRDDGKLADANAQFLLCASDTCPKPVADACREELSSIDKRLPSLVLSAKSSTGSDLVLVKVFIDGVAVTEKLDGRAIHVNPGQHKVRFEAAGLVVEDQVVALEGEKSRPVRVTFPAAGAVAPTKGASAPPESPAVESGGGVPVVTYVLGGVALASVGGFAYFGLTGKSEISDLRSTCAPRCNADDVDAAKTKMLVGDVLLGVAVVSAGLATYFVLAPKSAPAVTVGARGTGVFVDGRF